MPYSFMNDYSEGAHETILQALIETNRTQTAAYGMDSYSERARQLIRARCGDGSLAVHFITGGTQTNLLFIAHALRSYQAAIAAKTGHIHVHEAGAVEATGHKIIELASPDGKIRAEQVAALCQAHVADASIEHLAEPGLVYISQPTEVGTLYTLKELQALRSVCDQYGLILYADGARLGSALMAKENDVGLVELARLTDAFYIGGTKMGALCGEALVICTKSLQKSFRNTQTQRGAMPAKGRLIGLQFAVLLENGLYEDLAGYANRLADRLRTGLKEAGIRFYIETETNQLFPILPKKLVETLSDRFTLTYWEGYDETHDVMRLCTCWATDEKQVESFLQAVKEDLGN